MRKAISVTWGKPVVRLRFKKGISDDLFVITKGFTAILNNLLELCTGFMLLFSHNHKILTSSIKIIFIPIFHTTYNNERQYKLIYY